jgi:Zinc-binding dehydrogenase
MKAAVLHELGKPPRYEDFSDPLAGSGEAIVRVLAASLKPIEKQLAAGSHYASPRELPVVCGADGVGQLADGTRVFFGGPRRPYGAMAELTVVPAGFCFPVPKEMDDATAAALPNPGVSALLSLNSRAKVAKGETVLILGATGVTGTIAVQIAKLLGAGRVIGAGRNPEALEKLRGLGADATIQLNQPEEDLNHRLRLGTAHGSASCSNYAPRVCRRESRDSFTSSRRKRWTKYLASCGGPPQHGSNNSGNRRNASPRSASGRNATSPRMGSRRHAANQNRKSSASRYRTSLATRGTHPQASCHPLGDFQTWKMRGFPRMPFSKLRRPVAF